MGWGLAQPFLGIGAAPPLSLPLLEEQGGRVLDAAASKLAESQYEYDSFTEGLTASGAVQHDAAYARLRIRTRYVQGQVLRIEPRQVYDAGLGGQTD